MSDYPPEDPGPAPALVVVAVVLEIIAIGVIVLVYDHADRHPPDGPEATHLFGSGSSLVSIS